MYIWYFSKLVNDQFYLRIFGLPFSLVETRPEMQVHQEAFWEGDLMKMNEKKEDVFYKMSGAAQKHILTGAAAQKRLILSNIHL